MFQSTYDRVSKNARSKRFVLRDFQLALKPLVASWKPSEKLQEYENVDWHEVLVQLAREFWRKPMLFYSDVPRKEYLENIMIAESIVVDVVYRHMVDDSSAVEESDETDLGSESEATSDSTHVANQKTTAMSETIPSIEEPVHTMKLEEHTECWPQTMARKGDDEKTVAICERSETSSDNEPEPIKKIAQKTVDDIDIPDFDSMSEASNKSKRNSKTRQTIDNVNDKDNSDSTSIAKPTIVMASTKDYLKYYPTYKSTNMYLKRLHKKT